MINPPSVGSSTYSINSSSSGTTINVSTTNTFNAFRIVITSIIGSGNSANKQELCALSFMSINGDSYNKSGTI